jgi:hypothetical protein
MLTYVTTQRASPARAFRAVRTAGRVPDAARRLKSRTRQAFRQTQGLFTRFVPCRDGVRP